MNKREGMGKMAWLDGKEYIGMWKDDQMDGPGTISYATGEARRGVWALGEFQHI